MSTHRIVSLTLLVSVAVGIFARTDAAEPLIVAHRGLLRHAPENTLPNFRACLELRLGFEFDVQRSKDGHLVCIHDNTVDRTTNGNGDVAALTLEEIWRLDAGSWFDPKFTGTKVPTVAEVMILLNEFRQSEVLIAVDLKADNVAADVVRLAERQRVLNRLLFIGTTISDPEVRQQIKSVSARAQTAVVVNKFEEFQSALDAEHCDWVYARYIPPQEQIDAVHQAKKKVFIAGPTVAGQVPENWLQAGKVGVDGILTDYPLEIRDTFRPRTGSSVRNANGRP